MMIGIVVVVRMVFQRNAPSESSTSNEPSIALVNDVLETETNTAGTNTSEVNANLPTNTALTNSTAAASNTNTAKTSAAKISCTAALSSIPTTEKKIALTFDMAADNENVATLLQRLQDQKIPASFFVTGTYATKHPETTKRIAAQFEMGNHGFATSSFATMTAAQVKQQVLDTETAFQNALGDSDGSTPLIFRSPYGDATTGIVTGAKQAGYCTVLWTVDAFDWKADQTAAGAATRAIEKIKPGAILLFHAGYDITADAVDQVITAATNQGYSFATVSQLLSTSGD
jgi:peptidoglycan/xylan/chitin deacetylase (PgdA/CDA1 family)